MSGVSVRMRGMARALARIARLPSAVNEARNEALDNWANALEATAKDLAPKRTGNLRSDIKARKNTSAGKAWVGVFGDASKYGIYVEKGTSKMEAQPFLGPAAQIHRRTAERELRRTMPRRLGRL